MLAFFSQLIKPFFLRCINLHGTELKIMLPPLKTEVYITQYGFKLILRNPERFIRSVAVDMTTILCLYDLLLTYQQTGILC